MKDAQLQTQKGRERNPELRSWTIREKISQIDFFDMVPQDYVLHLKEGADLTYALFLKNTTIKLTIIAESPAVHGQIFAFVAGGSSSLQVVAKFQASHTAVKLHLMAIQPDEADVQMQGKIDIAA
ncbi:MAG: hypothetical protein LBG52_05455 [Candidatus Peribacteria bacterium]|jgi:hypothetical protein|nr:hypothetical protein [Candidatus Peribacteria bacterium]